MQKNPPQILCLGWDAPGRTEPAKAENELIHCDVQGWQTFLFGDFVIFEHNLQAFVGDYRII